MERDPWLGVPSSIFQRLTLSSSALRRLLLMLLVEVAASTLLPTLGSGTGQDDSEKFRVRLNCGLGMKLWRTCREEMGGTGAVMIPLQGRRTKKAPPASCKPRLRCLPRHFLPSNLPHLSTTWIRDPSSHLFHLDVLSFFLWALGFVSDLIGRSSSPKSQTP